MFQLKLRTTRPSWQFHQDANGDRVTFERIEHAHVCYEREYRSNREQVAGYTIVILLRDRR